MHNRKLGRTSDHRKALLRNMASQLIINGKIETTEGKAMELRSYVDSVITTAKKNDLAARRQAINELSNIKTKDGKKFYSMKLLLSMQIEKVVILA